MQWKKHFTRRRWLLEHERLDDFVVSCWQRGGSPLPLLVWRVCKLALVLAVWGWSFGTFWGPRPQWFIYMTHWGITAVALQAVLGVYISVAAHMRALPDSSLGLPWYVKMYWVLFNISAPVAFLITLFYWTILYNSDALVDYAPNPALDVALHGLNSVVMMLELATAAYPSRLLHVYQPVGFGLVYLIFGVVYFFAGGVDPWGNPWIYPVIDWRSPRPTAGLVAATTVAVFLLHFFTVALVCLRDYLSGKLVRKDTPLSGFTNDGFIAA